MTIELYLIRHGETDWSLSGQHTGRADIPLTEHGEAEAIQLAERLGDVQFSNVFSSPLQRAVRTCELAGLSGQAEFDNDLAEWDYGDYEGLTFSQIIAIHPNWNLFHDGCSGGEMPHQVTARADHVIERLRKLDGKVAIFAHGHLGRVLIARWIGLPVAAARSFLLDTASISIMRYDRGQLDRPVIALLNSKSR